MANQQRGTIKTWKDDKGFGFITPENGGSPVFFHISGLMQHQPRPSEQAVVFYTLSQDEKQRVRAVNIRIATKNGRPEHMLIIIVVSLFALALILGTLIIPLTPWIAALYGISSVITYALYVFDKAQAQQQGQRIPESTLHLLELIGGWPGALIAQAYQRHKTVKASYQRAFWLMVIINLLALIGYSCFILFS